MLGELVMGIVLTPPACLVGHWVGHGVNRYLNRRYVEQWLVAERQWKRSQRPSWPMPRPQLRDGVLAESVIARRVDGLTGVCIETVEVRRPSQDVIPGLDARGITGWG